MTAPWSSSPPGWPARWRSSTPTTRRPLLTKERKRLNAVYKYKGNGMKSRRARWFLLLRPLWGGTSRRQWPPGSPSPLYRTCPWRAAQRLARVGICPLSILWPSAPLSRASSVGLSISCSGGRDVPASGPSSCLRRTTSICRRLGVRTVLGTCPLARDRTSVGRI